MNRPPLDVPRPSGSLDWGLEWREFARELERRAAKLCDKLDQIANDPSYKSTWSLAVVHGRKYTGPNWKEEYEAMRELL